MQRPSPADDRGSSVFVRRRRGWQRYMVEMVGRMAEHLLQDYLKSTEYSAYEKVEMMLSMYVFNPWCTPDTSELKQYLQAVSADERFELLKKQYGWSHYTALHEAAERGPVEVMRCMLEMVEPENQIQLLGIPNEYNKTALDVAKGEETVQLIKQYIESAEREIAEGKSPRDLLSYVLNDLSLVKRQSLMSNERLRRTTFLVNWPHDDKRDVTTETSGELLEDSGDLKDAEEQNGMQSNEKEGSLPATSVNELVDGERCDVLLEPADEIKGITEDMDIPFQDTVVESKHSAVVDNVQPDSVLVQELELAKLKIVELETELAGYQSDAGRGSNELRDTAEGQIVSLTGVEVSSTTSDRTRNKDIAGTHKSLVNGDGDEPEHNSSTHSAQDGDEPEHNSSSRSAGDGDEPEHNSSSRSVKNGDEPEHNSSSHSAKYGVEPEQNPSSNPVEDGDEPVCNSSSPSAENGDQPGRNSSSYSAEDGDEPEHNSSSYSVEVDTCRIFSSTADEESLHLINITKNIKKDIDMPANEIKQIIDIVNTENIDLSLSDSTLFKPDVEPALSDVEVKVNESPEDEEMRDQISVLAQKLTDKLKNANQGVQLAAIRDICDGLIRVSPSNAAAATQQDVNGTQQSDLSVTTDAVEEVGSDNVSDEDQIHP